MFGFQPLSTIPFSTLSDSEYDPWLAVIPDANTWTGTTEVPNTWTPATDVANTWVGDGFLFSVLSSSGQSFSVSREVLTSTGVAYLVSGEVLTSSGVIVDLANPWQNISTASNTWSQ